MDKPIPKNLLAFLSDYETYYIIGHEDPDGDCIGSACALESFLNRRGKNTVLLSPGPFKRPELAHYAHKFRKRIGNTPDPAASAACILDCSTKERISTISEDIEHLYTAVIDHHAGGKTFGDIRYVDTAAPSVTLLIQKIFEESDMEITGDEAKDIMFGLCTDTGFFRHIEHHSAAIFDAVSRLVRTGITPKAIYQMMYGNRALSSRILLGRNLNRVTAFFDDTVLFVYESYEDTMELGISNRDSDTLYNLLQTTTHADCIIFAREEENGTCSVGLRSHRFDVSAMARDYGGGGHKKAAGFTWDGSLSDLKKSIMRYLSSAFSINGS